MIFLFYLKLPSFEYFVNSFDKIKRPENSERFMMRLIFQPKSLPCRH